MLSKILLVVVVALMGTTALYYVRSSSFQSALIISVAELDAEKFQHAITTERLVAARETALKQVTDITKLSADNLKARREVFSLSSRLDELRTENDVRLEHQNDAPVSSDTPTESDPNVPLPAPKPSFADALSRLAADANRLLERNGKPEN